MTYYGCLDFVMSLWPFKGRTLNTLGLLSHIYMGDNFVTSCLLSWSTFGKGCILKGKNLLTISICSASKFFPFRVDCFSDGQ